MKLEPTLQKGKFLKRYKRFFADFEYKGKIEVAHVPNTGSMKSCNVPGSDCLVSLATNPERKLRWTLEAVKSDSTGAWVGVNTARPNQLVQEAFHLKTIADWNKFTEIKAEVKINQHTRLDFLLQNKKVKRYVEVKNVTLADGETALFPDAVTERGQKHLQELMDLIDQGYEAEILFVVQREDCQQFTVADEIDPEYGKLLRKAAQKGLIVSPYKVHLSENEISLTSEKLKVIL